jgi:hypothetical protein
MSIFGFYFVSGILREAGWPKKQGIFRKEVLDSTILDSAIDEMIDWAAALGAGRPALALQTIAEIFRDRDWSSEDAPNIRKFIENVRLKNPQWSATGAIAPSEVVLPTRFTRAGPTLPAKALAESEMRLGLEHWFLEGALYGLANPEALRTWYEARYDRQTTNLGSMRQAGLEIEALPDYLQYLANCENVLRSYERDIGPLPAIPDKLIADARLLGKNL